MSENTKKIYVSLEMGDNEIKMLVSEYYNTRFNVIKSAHMHTNAFNGFRIADRDLLVSDLKSLIDDVSKKVGAKIEKTILVLPAYNFKRFPLRSKVVPTNGMICKQDIARAITNSLKSDVDFDSIVANPVILKYTINDLSTRRLPEKEVCDELMVDIDLLCCDKELTINYVEAVEQAGLQVLDICLNSYAICKEASLLEESLKQNVILLDINDNITFLSLLSKGKLVTTEVIYEGLNQMASKISSTFAIPYDQALRLIKYSVDYDSVYSDDVVYSYNDDLGDSKVITIKQLSNLIEKPLNDFSDKLVTMCKPILDQGETLVYVTGIGQDMMPLTNKLSEKMHIDIKNYYSDTIGARDSSMVSLCGSFVLYKDKADLNNLTVNCIDLLEYNNLINRKKVDVEGESLTTKIKNLFVQYIN